MTSAPLRTRVRLLHTSDLHLGASAKSLEGLGAVVDAALEHHVDAVLIAGDLFDNARIGDDVIEAAVEQLRRLGQPVVVIPGNHDCVDAGSVYRRADLELAGAHVTFVGEPEGRTVVFADLGLAIWARGIEDHHPGHHPLSGYRPGPPDYWQVVLTHGHYVRDGSSDRSSQVHHDEIGALDCDYVALGHWHHFHEIRADRVVACYSGSPTEPVGGPSTVNIVTLDPSDGIAIERVPLGTG